MRLLVPAAMIFALAIVTQPARAQDVGLEVSAGVAFNPHGPNTRSVGTRALTAEESRLVRARAERFYEVVRATAAWRTPTDRAHLFTSVAGFDPPGVIIQDLIAYWTVPRDARRRPDGILTPLLGGAHDLLYFDINRSPHSGHFIVGGDDFARGVKDRSAEGYFSAPRTFGEAGGPGGGLVFADLIWFTRDGRSPFQPAPVGEVLKLELARLREAVRAMEQGAAERLREVEASMSPERVAERRAKREEAWRRETRDPDAMTRRLDAAHRSDVSNLERERSDFTPPEQPDPRNRFWGPRLALQAAEQTFAALQAQGAGALAAQACGRREPGFASNFTVRYDVAGAKPDCAPLVQLRRDLIDPRRPAGEAQIVTAYFRGSRCGEAWTEPTPRGGRCGYALPLLREMDWSALRRVLGW